MDQLNALKTPHGYPGINAQFGNPAGPDGKVNPAWEAANIILVKPPGGWKFFYQDTGRIVPTSGIRIHRLLQDSFNAVLNDIWQHAIAELGGNPTDDQVRDWLHNLRLDITGGGYNFRASTGNAGNLSLHSYGIAIDWDPLHNPHQRPLTVTLPDWWFDIWAAHGWTDGRHFGKPDPMHVQFATGA